LVNGLSLGVSSTLAHRPLDFRYPVPALSAAFYLIIQDGPQGPFFDFNRNGG
jgi:hypothetical protein